MKLATCFGLVFMGIVLPAFATPTFVTSCSAIAPQVQRLLVAYSQKNVADVLAMTDPHALLVLGTDISEIADSRPAVAALLKADFMLWGRSEFGRPKFMACRVSSTLSTAALDVPFSMHRQDAHNDTMTIRFLTVWHKVGRRWLLTQSLNSVPSLGQSAADILKRSARSP